MTYQFTNISGFQLAQMVKNFMVKLEIRGSISAYIKNWLMSWFDDNNKKLLSGAKALSQNYLKKIKRKLQT